MVDHSDRKLWPGVNGDDVINFLTEFIIGGAVRESAKWFSPPSVYIDSKLVNYRSPT